MQRYRMARASAVFCLLPLLLSGCLVAAAGAGAGAAIAWTQRGASSLVEGSIEQVFQRSSETFRRMEIAQTGEGTADSGNQRRLTGQKGDLEVTVELERESASTTRVEVYARRSPVEWDKGYARDVLHRIVRGS